MNNIEMPIPTRAISFGSSGISMVVAVDADRLNEAINVSYDTFIKNPSI